MSYLASWAEALLHTLLPEQADPQAIVLLASDDEAVRSAGALLGQPEESALASLVNEATRGGDLRLAANEISAFEHAEPPRATPAFLPALCLCVLAATRMGEGSTSGREFYERLGETIGVPLGPGNPPFPGFDVLCTRGFPALADWLARDQQGRRGQLWLDPSPTRRFVGPPITQALLRSVDRRALGSFFHQHSRALASGWDPARLLSGHGARHLLTRSAQETLADPARRPLLAASLRAAFASWDGSLHDLDGTRVLATHLFARLVSGRLALSLRCDALSGEERGQGPDGPVLVPAGPQELALPLGWLKHAVNGSVSINLLGRRRLRAFPGPTILFAVTPLGLEAVPTAGTDSLWLLTCQEQLTCRLPPESIVPVGLPDSWSLHAEINPDLLDDSLRAPTGGEAACGGGLLFPGGLALADGVWLASDPPKVAVELGEGSEIHIDGRVAGRILPGQSFDLHLLHRRVGVHEIRVGSAEGKVELCERGLRDGYGTIGHPLRGGVAPPSGARALNEEDHPVRVRGALIEGDESLPAPPRVFVRLCGTVELIDEDGTVRSCYPPRPGRWAEELDVQSGGGRWALPDGHRAIWACSLSPPRRALLLRSDVTPPMTAEFAALLDNHDDCLIEDLTGAGDAEQRWQRLLECARQLERTAEASRG